MVVHACNLSTQEAEEGGSKVPGQPGLHSEILSSKKKFNSRPKTIREAGHGGPLCFRKILYALLCPRTELSFCLWGRPLGNSYKGSGSL
jgi:hypothetical protein